MNLITKSNVNHGIDESINSQDEQYILTDQRTLDQKNAKILFYFHPSERLWSVPHISDHMVVIGPLLDENSFPPYVKGKIYTQPGLIDLGQVLEKAAEFFEPDILICWYDGIGWSGLKNTQNFKGIKVMIVGDYHHMHKSLENNLHYAKMGKFDLCLFHDRRMVSVFRKFTEAKLLYAGALLATSEKVFLPQKENILGRIFHVGQSHQFHIKRQHYLSSLKKLDMPIDDLKLSKQKAAEFYNKYAATINISLNSEYNARSFNVIAAGGVLVTDKLSSNAGINDIYSDKEILTFASLDESYNLLRKILGDDEFRYNTALNAQRKYQETIGPKISSEQFWNAVNGRRISPLFDLNEFDSFNKTIIYKERYPWENVKVFQIIQECHRASSSVKIDIHGWLNGYFSSLDGLNITEVDYIDPLSKKAPNCISSGDLNHDTTVLITKTDVTGLYNTHDLIVQKSGLSKAIPKNYTLLDADSIFSIFKKNLITTFPKKVNIPGIDLAQTDARASYETAFLSRYVLSQTDFSDQNILLVGGTAETHELLKKKGNSCDHQNFHGQEISSFLNNNSRSYDLIIFFDQSKNLEDFSCALRMIYGFMNLSAKLVFHSARFVLGPYGWTKHYPFLEKSDSNEKDPWYHIIEANDMRRTEVTLAGTDRVSKDPFIKYFERFSKSVDYNAAVIPKLFLQSGLKITDNLLIPCAQSCPIRNFSLKTNCGHFEIAPAISHQVLLAEKALWLDGTKENTSYLLL